MNHVSTLLASKDKTVFKTLAKYITEAMSVKSVMQSKSLEIC